MPTIEMTPDFCSGCHIPALLTELAQTDAETAERFRKAYLGCLARIAAQRRTGPDTWAGDVIGDKATVYPSCCVIEEGKFGPETALDVINRISAPRPQEAISLDEDHTRPQQLIHCLFTGISPAPLPPETS